MAYFVINPGGESHTMADTIILLVLSLISAILAGILLTLRRRWEISRAADEARFDQAEALAEAVLDAAVDGIVTIDERGTVKSFNHAAERIFGYAASEVIGHNVSMLMPDPYHTEHDGYLRNYLATNQPRIIGIGREVEGRRRDGTTFPMELAVGERRRKGRRIFAGIVRDISARRLTEERLRASEARTRAILEAAVDGIVTIDERGIILGVNTAVERIFGYAAAEMVGRDVSMLMPEPYRSAHDGYLHNYLNTGQARIIGIGREVEGLRKDGSVFPMDLAVGEGMLGGGRIFAGIVRDITDRRLVEEKLRASEERLRALVDGVRDYSIAMLDPDGRIVSWPPGSERIYGWSAEEVVGSSTARFFPLDAIARGEHELALATARDTGRYETEGWRLRKDGSRFWDHVAVTALYDEGGRLQGFARISRDMTERKRHEDDLTRAREDALRAAEVAEQARGEAERANIAKTKFLAAASHDLRQPVQAIFFFASVLSHKLHGHSAHAVLEDLQGSLDGLNILLDSLLDVSKLDAGMVVPRETDFSINAILDRMSAEFAALARDKGIELRTVPSTAMVRSDPALLSRIVQNLMANAVRYTSRGRVLVGCRRRGQMLAVEVWDSGIGIPADRLKDIFEEFTQLGNPERDRSQGLGLGLAIVERLARLLGHRIAVRSEPGRGSVFSVEVPRIDALAATAPARRRRTLAAPGAGRLVVIIDDEPVVLKGLSMVLKNWGYEVIAAGSEAEAMDKLAGQDKAPSMILADYRLREGHTGTEAVAHIRDRFQSAIPSILITGDSAPERLREAEASGLAILHKPVQPPELREMLRDTLDNPDLRQMH
ncbi:MAG: PAS domain S-box protein [Magnetospirillum sp.]|nr:PAS domain S-box protein [Magnetospirillum sp.]